MLHRRTSADTAPVGAAVKRVLTVVRTACDEAPACDGAVTLALPFAAVLDTLLVDLAHILEAASVVSCRAPPGVLR